MLESTATVIRCVRVLRRQCGEFAARRYAEKRGLGRLFAIALDLELQDEAVRNLEAALAARRV